ncbi:MAG: transposase, partial [Sulfurimonas sp.]|nr:transposase [Sulfurimonas sp.]
MEGINRRLSGQRAKWISNNLQTSKKIVHIVDRESDSVAFMRDLHELNELFLLRVKNNSKVYYPKEEIDIKQSDLANKLPLGKEVKSIKYKNKKVKIYVNECAIEVRRDATKFIVSSDGKGKLQKTQGEPIKARFIVERLVDENNNVVAQWLLVTNILDTSVTKEILATWYYYRWKIESYFKLLKSSGFNMEEWQQREPIALFRRLLVVSYACVLVWKIANDNSKNGAKIREFLVLLSGRLIERGKEFTHPALLAGLENYIQILDLLSMFSKEELLDMKQELVNIMGINI